MQRWWLVIALLLSLGINLGLILGRVLPRPAAPEGTTGPEGPELPDPRAHGPPLGGPPAGPPAHGPAAGEPPRFAYRMADELGLESAERQAFVERQRQFVVDTLGPRERIGELQAALRRQLVAENPDRREVDDLLRQIGDAHVDLERAFVDNLFATRELLDAEQERRYIGWLHRLRHARSGERFGGGPPPWGEGRRFGRDRPRPPRRRGTE